MGFGPQGTWPTPSGPGTGGAFLPAYGASANMFSNAGALSADYTQKYGEAKAANESRYAEGMKGYGDLYDRNMGRLEQTSGQNAADIRQNANTERGNINQRMSSLGLGGTTIGDTLKSGVNKEENASLNRNADNQIGNKNAADASLTGAKLGFLERRSDPYPDMGAYSSIMASMGRADAMGGGGMGGGSLGGAGGGGGMGGGGNSPYGANMGGYGSTIEGDMGMRQTQMTKDQYGNNTWTSRTPMENKLAANPMFLDTAPAGNFNQNSGMSSNPYPYDPYSMQPQMMQRQQRGF